MLSPRSGAHVWETIPTNATPATCARCGRPVFVLPGAVPIRVSADEAEAYPPTEGTPGRGVVHIVVCGAARGAS